MSGPSYDVALTPETTAAFAAYVADAERGMDEAWRAESTRLWSARLPERTQKIQDGEAVVEMWSGSKPVSVPHGLIHDWVGAVLVPGANVEKTLALMQDYDHHHVFYKPDVIQSKLISRESEHFVIYLRLLKKKVITVVLDTEHDVQYTKLDAKCWTCRSRTTRIAEVREPGSPKESVLPPGTGHGFLWNLNSYWLLVEGASGTTVECRAISLTRDIPLSLKLVVQPIVRNLPRESLVATLRATQKAVRERLLEASAG